MQNVLGYHISQIGFKLVVARMSIISGAPAINDVMSYNSLTTIFNPDFPEAAKSKPRSFSLPMRVIQHFNLRRFCAKLTISEQNKRTKSKCKVVKCHNVHSLINLELENLHKENFHFSEDVKTLL